MNFFKILIILIFGLFAFSISYADSHGEVVEKAKDVIKNLENNVDDEEVPLNDPFAGNEASSRSNANIPQDEAEDEMSLYNFKLSGLISGKDESYISLTNVSGDVITLNLNQYLGKIKFIDLRLTEAIFEKEDKSFIIIDFNNQIREADEY